MGYEKMSNANLIKYVWDHPEEYKRICYICDQPIKKIMDVEMDHIIPKSGGGKKMAMTHNHCNRVKSTMSYSEARELLKPKKVKKAKKTSNKDKFESNLEKCIGKVKINKRKLNYASSLTLRRKNKFFN
jgi:5-methylcytosine-specific restriction endonuclease McrA